MTLDTLLSGVRSLSVEARHRVAQSGRGGAVVTGVTHDSRGVAKGSVFVAVPGLRTDGARFANDAVARGAIAVIAESDRPDDVAAADVPWVTTPHARTALAELSAVFHEHPSEHLTVVGVTGTNGKTTTTYVLAAIFDAAGWPCGRIGTVTVRVGPNAGDEREASHTTPEASDLQRLLAEMRRRGCRACAMEVSSHALAQHRVDQLRIAAAIFTNLTRDHLDFHGDMQQYFAAKRILFDMLPPGAPAIVNVDDPKGQELAASLPKVVTFAIDRPADVRAVNVAGTLDGLAFDVETPRGRLTIRSPLVGKPNVSNLLAGIATGIALDLPLEAIERGAADLDRVPGRFQLVSDARDDVRVIVDYAHTDDALKNLLETARPLADKRVITVFGCGGDRDRSKRPLMGAVAGRLSDFVVLTSDNPRSEDPERILDEIVRGLSPTPEPGAPKRVETPFVRQSDRRTAIDTAIKMAAPGDLVLIAGKGHEKYQIIGDRTLPFDDVEVARGALSQRRTAARAR